jgi:hypothetical protein
MYKELKTLYTARGLKPPRFVGSTKTQLATLLTEAKAPRPVQVRQRDEKRQGGIYEKMEKDEPDRKTARKQEIKRITSRAGTVGKRVKESEIDRVLRLRDIETGKRLGLIKLNKTDKLKKLADERRDMLKDAKRLNAKNPEFKIVINKNLETSELKDRLKILKLKDERKHYTDDDRKLYGSRARTLRELGINYDTTATMEQLTQLLGAHRKAVEDLEAGEDPQILKEMRRKRYSELKTKYLDTGEIITEEDDLTDIILYVQKADRTGMIFRRDGIDTVRNLNFSSEESRLTFLDMLIRGYTVDDSKNNGTKNTSDADGSESVHIDNDPRWISIAPLGREKAGHYFDYNNKTNIDLTRYQIYREEADKKEYERNGLNHCLINCLELHGIDSATCTRVGLIFQCNGHYAKSKLIKVANIIGKNINLYEYDEETKTDRKRITIIGDYKEAINIALYRKHYFIFEAVKFTVFSSKNWDRCKDHKRPGDIVKFRAGERPRYKTADEKYTNSLTLIRNLFNDEKFTRIEYRPHEVFTKKPLSLDIIEHEQRPYIFKQKEDGERKTRIFYADIETYLSEVIRAVDDTNTITTDDEKKIKITVTKNKKDIVSKSQKHIPFLTGIINETDNDATIYHGAECVSEMLNYVYRNSSDGDNIIIYFHNLKYDISTMSHLLYYVKTVEKGNTVYSIDIKHANRIYHLRDSFKLIPQGLAKFQQTFNLPFGKKEAIGYGYYKADTTDTANISDYLAHIKKDDHEQFFKNLRDEPELFQYDEKQQNFNCMTYYKYYLNYDCLTLRAGLNIFNDSIKQLTDDKINITKVLTTSSMGHAYASIMGAYDGVYEITGNLRAYVAQAVQGGRVQANKEFEKKEIIISGGVQILDAVSLYPSSIERLGQENGLPVGPAKRFIGEPPADTCYFIAEVVISKINKSQQMPFVCVKDDIKKSLQYLNEVKENITVFIDSRTLEDWEHFQKIEYKIIQGVYWNEGFNNKIGQIIRHLYNERARFKQLKNSGMSEIIKLIMNSLYGKTIQKTSNSTIIYKDDFNYIRRNWENITYYTDKGRGQYRIKMSTPDDSFNLGHIGTTILSMSKRIMNELQDLTNEMKILTFYGDTDSSFIQNSEILRLDEEYKKRYGRPLLGDDLQQQQFDFSLYDVKKQNIKATKAIFLGKKSYCCFIEGDGKSKFHYKLKGVSVHSIQAKANAEFNGDIYEMYKAMSTGQATTFILNPSDLQPSFVFRNHEVFTMPAGSFTRSLSF